MKILKLFTLLYPSSVIKILKHLYVIAHKTKKVLRTEILTHIISTRKYNTIVEIGVWKANNLLSLADDNSNCFFYGVDPYMYETYGENVNNDEKQNLLIKDAENIYGYVLNQAKKRNNVEIIKKTSLEAVKNFKNRSVDLVFIDALHTYKDVKDDILHWLPKIKAGGCLCGHDFSFKYLGVVLAVIETLGVDNVYTQQDNTWFFDVK